MSSDYSFLYDAYYFNYRRDPYARNEQWLKFFEQIAERIIHEINPQTVLDAGCAIGLLVESLRKGGVDAWGIDISEYAIENIDELIKPYCWVGSITDPLPQKYDLIVSIEVVEHLPKAEADRAIANLCQYTDDIILSTTPLDFQEPTHINVRPVEYWAQLFARHGFYRDIDFDATFITPWAGRFRRSDEPIHRVVLGYERKLWLLQKEKTELRQQTIIMGRQASDLAERLRQNENGSRQLGEQLTRQQERMKELENSFSWKMLAKLQRLRNRILPSGSYRERLYQRITKPRSLTKQKTQK